MKHRDVTTLFETWAKPSYAYDWDPIGYQWGNPEDECKGIVVALDLTSAVLDQAIENNANLIVTHHPTWFQPVPKLLAQNGTDLLALRAIQAGITVYAAHTNLDAAPEGVSYAYAKSLFPEQNFVSLQENEDFPEAGCGVLTTLESPLSSEALQAQCQKAWQFIPSELTGFKSPSHFGTKDNTMFQTVAFWGGSWDDTLLPVLLDKKVDLLFVGETKWHVLIAAKEAGVTIIPTGHGQSESWILPKVKTFLQRKLNDSLPIEVK